MSEELRPCPFCGKSDIHIEQKGTFFWCECYDCGAISREHHTLPGVNVLQSEDFARGYWNQRPLEDVLTSRIAELEAERRWIPVSERLPDIEDGDSKDYDVVLTYPFRRDVIVATWSYDALDKTHRRRWFDCWSDEWGPDDITDYVTHWRERPTPPEVER